MNKEIWEVEFGECEHGGDLECYAAQLAECGAEVLESLMLSEEDETGKVVVAVESGLKRSFLDKLQADEVVGFVTSIRPLCE